MSPRFKLDSPAVMARRQEPRDSLDDFPTPPWATRALCVHVIPLLHLERPLGYVLEPAAGRGHMVRALREHITAVVAADICHYGAGEKRQDFLFYSPPDDIFGTYDAVITNPPFRLAAQFAKRALGLAPIVALLVRTAWTETIERYSLFQAWPPALIAQFAERVPMVKGRLDRKASTATAYCWVVWAKGQTDTRWRHIPPCRRELERDGDYADPIIPGPVIARSLAEAAPAAKAGDEAIQSGSPRAGLRRPSR